MDFIYQVLHAKTFFVPKQGLAKLFPHCCIWPLPSPEAVDAREWDPLILTSGSQRAGCRVLIPAGPFGIPASPCSLTSTEARGLLTLTCGVLVGFITAAFQPGKGPCQEMAFHCSPAECVSIAASKLLSFSFM